MQFWNGWELWEKMCFVLGALIVIVLIYSFGVLAYNRRKLKKYAAVEACQKAEQHRDLDLEEIRRNDIPFGARALESGIQIEGIWISNNNTPLPSPRQPGTPLGSRPPSPTSRQTSQPPTAAVTAQAEKRPVACSALPQLNDSRPSRYASRASSAKGSFPDRQACSHCAVARLDFAVAETKATSGESERTTELI
ncbi:hypothetical protein VTN00DRAFT_4331 [Thermoascus crustaceus]|uniref:uncharacterized protein n=1 Tax=Thermoascus crustaceus TaxID=5088 RepID=UPI0037436E6D